MRQRPIGALTPAYSILDPVREFVDNSLSIGAYKKANGRLHISLTTLNKFNFPVNKVVSSYSSDEELREVRILILVKECSHCYVCVRFGKNNIVIGYPWTVHSATLYSCEWSVTMDGLWVSGGVIIETRIHTCNQKQFDLTYALLCPWIE